MTVEERKAAIAANVGQKAEKEKQILEEMSVMLENKIKSDKKKE